MTILTTRRGLLKGLIAAPLIIPITNLMPVSTKLIKASAEELVNYEKWALISSQGKKFWTPTKFSNRLNIEDKNIIKEIKMPLVITSGKDATKITIDLMKEEKGSSVYWEWSANYIS